MEARNTWLSWLVALLALTFVFTAGCAENEESDEVEGQMAESGTVAVSAGDVAEGWVEADNPMAAVSASLKVVLSDEEVATLLDSDGVGAKVAKAFDRDCYVRSPGAGLSLEFDFTGCDDYGLAGTVTVTKKVVGPIVITFNEGFAIKTVEITGSLALTRITGKQLTFTAFNSDDDGVEGTPITIVNTKKGDTSTATYDGHMKVSVADSEVLLWGVSVTTQGSVTNTYYLGGTSADAVAGDDPPAGAVTYPYSPLDCYCPTTGVVSGGVSITITEVEFDVNDFFTLSKDYPGFAVPVSMNVSGTATVTFAACGEYSLDFEATTDSILNASVSKEQLLVALETAKSKLSEEAYNFIKGLLEKMKNPSVSIEISPEELETALGKFVGDKYDLSFCEV